MQTKKKLYWRVLINYIGFILKIKIAYVCVRFAFYYNYILISADKFSKEFYIEIK